MNENKPQTDDKKKKKKRLILVIVILALLGAVSYVLTNHPEIFQTNKKKDAVKSGVTSMYSDELYSYSFYPTDYDLDPTKVKEYMELDRQLWYQDGALSIGFDMNDPDSFENYPAALPFFAEYFKTVIAGDTETYNSYFTERYYKDNDPYVQFAPQMIWDIHVNQLSESLNGTSTVWMFDVWYQIYHNDGTFRNDLPPDGGSKKLLFTLVGDARGNVKIDAIDYYRRSK